VTVFRKATSLFTLAAFVVMSVSCVTMRTKTVVAPSDLPGKGAKITSVITASGERVEFSRSGPGRIRGAVITGTAAARYSVPVEIQGPFSSIKKRPDGSVYEITDGHGRVYAVVRVSNEGDTKWTILINDTAVQPVSIPLSEVKQITYRKSRPALTAIAIAIPVVLGLLLVAGIIAADME
jgi:hypothetical protein